MQISETEKLLVRLFRTLPPDERESTVLQVAEQAVRANFSAHPLESDEAHSDAQDRISELQPQSEMTDFIGDWWGEFVSDFFQDGYVFDLFRDDEHLSARTDDFVELIHISCENHDVDLHDADVAFWVSGFLHTWRDRVLDALEQAATARTAHKSD